jgi:light-regulated signal transduction histidine kinase (bacteriophytochrome)
LEAGGRGTEIAQPLEETVEDFTAQQRKVDGELPGEIFGRRYTEEEIKRVNGKLKNRFRRLEVTNKELEAFIYFVPHDLSAPLRAIDGFSRLVLENYGEKLDDQGKKLLNVIRSNVQKMGKLIDTLLALSHLGQREINLSKVEMDKLAGAVFEELNPAASETLELRVKTPPNAWGDASLIRQVLLNLISNAIKFTKPKVVRMIEVGGWRGKNSNIYYVKDNGVGFDRRYGNKLFGLFQRFHSAKEFEGMGVGLAIVKSIIHRQGGRVWAEGKVNEEATFYFTLPRPPAASDHGSPR